MMKQNGEKILKQRTEINYALKMFAYGSCLDLVTV